MPEPITAILILSFTRQVEIAGDFDHHPGMAKWRIPGIIASLNKMSVCLLETIEIGGTIEIKIPSVNL